MCADIGNSNCAPAANSWPRATIRWAVVQEMKRRGTARGLDIARALNLKPTSVSCALYKMRDDGCVKRIKTGVYEFVRMPENLYNWDDGIDPDNIPVATGRTLCEKLASLVRQAPNGTISFHTIWKVSGLERKTVGALLSDMVSRGLVRRIRRGLYALPE